MTSVSAINEWMKRLCYLHLKAIFILSTVTLIYVNSCALHLYQAIPSLYAREYFLCVDFNVILALASRSVIYRVQIVCAHRFSSLFPGEPGSWVDARWTFFRLLQWYAWRYFEAKFYGPRYTSWRQHDRPKVFHYCQHSEWPLLTL